MIGAGRMCRRLSFAALILESGWRVEKDGVLFRWLVTMAFVRDDVQKDRTFFFLDHNINFYAFYQRRNSMFY